MNLGNEVLGGRNEKNFVLIRRTGKWPGDLFNWYRRHNVYVFATVAAFDSRATLSIYQFAYYQPLCVYLAVFLILIITPSTYKFVRF